VVARAPWDRAQWGRAPKADRADLLGVDLAAVDHGPARRARELVLEAMIVARRLDGTGTRAIFAHHHAGIATNLADQQVAGCRLPRAETTATSRRPDLLGARGRPAIFSMGAMPSSRRSEQVDRSDG
jgi:hypothetical protein